MHDSATIVLVLSVGLLLYFLFGYPVLLAVFPWRRGHAIAKDPSRVRPVTVLLPVYNGEAFLRQKLESILALDYPRDPSGDSGHLRQFNRRDRHGVPWAANSRLSRRSSGRRSPVPDSEAGAAEIAAGRDSRATPNHFVEGRRHPCFRFCRAM